VKPIHFSENLKQFTTYRIKNITPIWEDSGLIQEYFKSTDYEVDEFDLSKLCSYGIIESSYFSSFDFDTNDKEILHAEMYGGVGVGKNLGGVRCGNLAEFQIKGIGKNLLAHNEAPQKHSNGTLSLLDGAIEAIYAQVLSRLLPHGVVSIFALSATGQQKAYCEYSGDSDKHLTWGALLVRQQALRPAHFLRNASLSKEDSKYFISDYNRTKNMNLRMKKKFSSIKEFHSFLSHSLEKHAQQFAFSYIARIIHGGISPSNLTFEGSWLDLNTAGFLDTGKNYSVSERAIPFLSERKAISTIYKEFIYTFSKCNGLALNSSNFLTFYDNQLNKYKNIYSLWVLGFPKKIVANELYSYYEVIGGAIDRVLSRNVNIVTPLPRETNNHDLVISFIKELLIQLVGEPSNTKLYLISEEVVHAFKIIYLRYSQQDTFSNINSNAILRSLIILALKRSSFQSFFFRQRVTDLILKKLRVDDFHYVFTLIETYRKASDWIFYNENEKSVLFKSKQMCIYYCFLSERYILHMNNDEACEFYNDEMSLIARVESMGRNNFMLVEYCFKENLIHLLKIVAMLPLNYGKSINEKNRV